MAVLYIVFIPQSRQSSPHFPGKCQSPVNLFFLQSRPKLSDPMIADRSRTCDCDSSLNQGIIFPVRHCVVKKKNIERKIFLSDENVRAF